MKVAPKLYYRPDKGIFEYYAHSKILELFPEWKDAFDYFQMHRNSKKLKKFTAFMLDYFKNHKIHNAMDPMHAAIYAGNISIVSLILEAPLDFNKIHPGLGSSDLHYEAAIHGGNIAPLLLEAPFKSNIHPGLDSSYLHDAVILQMTNVVQLFAESPSVDFNVRNAKSKTPLHLAPSCERIKVVRTLLESKENKNIDINAQDEDGLTPLHIACRNHNVGILISLLDHGSDITLLTNDGENVFHLAAQNKNSHVIGKLLEYEGIDINARDGEGFTPMHIACMGNTWAVINKLLNHGVNATLLTSNGDSVFHMAAGLHKHPQVLVKLLEHEQLQSIDKNLVNHQGNTMVDVAVVNLHTIGSITYLLRNAINLNLDANSIANALVHAGGETCKLLDFLIKNADQLGIDLNHRSDDLGHTLFHWACYSGKLENVKKILHHSRQYNIDIDAKTNAGESGQDIAREEGHENIVELLENWKLEQT